MKLHHTAIREITRHVSGQSGIPVMRVISAQSITLLSDNTSYQTKKELKYDDRLITLE